jgi:hypothetical protein
MLKESYLMIPVHVAEAASQGNEVEVSNVLVANQNGKEFVEDNVLPLCVQDSSRFLKWFTRKLNSKSIYKKYSQTRL